MSDDIVVDGDSYYRGFGGWRRRGTNGSEYDPYVDELEPFLEEIQRLREELQQSNGDYRLSKKWMKNYRLAFERERAKAVRDE